MTFLKHPFIKCLLAGRTPQAFTFIVATVSGRTHSSTMRTGVPAREAVVKAAP